MKPMLLDSRGNRLSSVSVTPSKKAMGLYGNIFGYGNAGKFKYRYYTLADNNQGIDTYSRELLVRWSRELAAQLPIVSTAIDIISQFSIGNAYLPEYRGENAAWGKIATDFLVQEFYPHCNVRGQKFQNCLSLMSKTIDRDGDLLQVYGQDKYGFPMFQVIMSNRIRSATDNSVCEEGPYKGCMISDGVIYSPQGLPVAYCVTNAANMVQADSNAPLIVFNSNESHLIYQQEYFDKCRGLPSIAPAILQGISLQELDQYEMDKAKINSMVAYQEKTATGEAPLELQQTFQTLLNDTSENGNALNISPNDHAVKIINGPEIRYVRSEGGEIKSFQTSGPTNDAQEYMTKLEIQVLSTLNVPAQLVFHPDKIGGRVTSAAAELFRAGIRERQALLDERCSFVCGWALAKAIKLGLIPDNDKENLTKVFDFTKPPIFSLDSKYDNDIVLSRLDKGVCTLNDATTQIMNRTATDVMQEQEKELTEYITRAQNISKKTGVSLDVVMANWKQTAIKVTNTIQTDPNTTEQDNEK